MDNPILTCVIDNGYGGSIGIDTKQGLIVLDKETFRIMLLGDEKQKVRNLALIVEAIALMPEVEMEAETK